MFSLKFLEFVLVIQPPIELREPFFLMEPNEVAASNNLMQVFLTVLTNPIF